MTCRCLSGWQSYKALPPTRKQVRMGWTGTSLRPSEKIFCERINHLEHVSYIYTALADKCIYNETNRGLQLAPLMLGALFQPFPLSQISLFPSTHKVSLFQPPLMVIFLYFIKVWNIRMMSWSHVSEKFGGQKKKEEKKANLEVKTVKYLWLPVLSRSDHLAHQLHHGAGQCN